MERYKLSQDYDNSGNLTQIYVWKSDKITLLGQSEGLVEISQHKARAET